MANEKQVCTGCGEPKALSEFYASSSPFHKFFGKLSICKECFWDYVDADNDDIDLNKLVDALRMIDKPFIIDLIEPSIQEAKRDNKSVSKIYMKNIAMRQYKDLTWNDSQFDEFEKAPDDLNTFSEDAITEEKFDEEIRKRWIGYTDPKQVSFLENFYQELINTYESKTPMQRNIYKNMAETQLLANEARAQGKIKEYQDLLKTLSTLMTDAKIKPLQDTGEQDGGLSTWGQWIKKIEETEPIPEPKDEFKDVDGIGKYINKWFTSHFAKVFGVADTNTVHVDDANESDGDKHGRV